ncbi:MAG: glycosyltransferase [Chloroflexi bacterium]|nr:glycosyltransferase [Chloroflexota bacterium]
MTFPLEKNPKITVLMAVYNGEKYLTLAIESILSQTYRDFEFLIIDDGSTDRSADIVRSFSDPRIKYFKNPKNIGLPKSLNTGIKLAKGELIARFDQDDISLPERFQKQVDYLHEHPEIGLLSCGFQRVDEKGNKLGQAIVHPEESYLLKYWLLFECVLLQPGAMIQKKLLTEVGLYDPQFVLAEDLNLWNRLAAKTTIANMQEVLVHYREHATNTSLANKGIQLHYHTIVSSREVLSLTGKEYPQELFTKMISKFKLDPISARKVINLYLDTAGIYEKKYHLNENQKKRLWHMISWRINKIIQRTPWQFLLIPEIVSMYWNNHDLLVRNFRSFLRRKKPVSKKN